MARIKVMAGVDGVVFFFNDFSKLRKSKYQPRPFTCSARAKTRSLAEQNDNPGGKANAFCDEVRQRSIPQASTGISVPAKEETASTNTNVSGLTWWTAAAISFTGLVTPVLVSLWTTVIASIALDPMASESAWLTVSALTAVFH